MTSPLKKIEKCDNCGKEFRGAKYLSDLGYICEKCLDEEHEEG